ncbi:YbdK family carboxylate-amine ligase [Rubrivivax gelatinosus]|uniref:Putative glutamate--cysteine ligase 2 n=1 Tax=Rubrivivax gelatinosus TaxID=28068 RepID=A0A4R2M3H4_RUBGE|nr:YbdK family carboxylate-amine ligase [Rubrivivax gelatinosus]MBK1689932.1 glutamate--cysteine ligase [Rubrivivax gelatinosus]TCO98746.1 carboxylate-amine ligase [Rubrivivax gelatinosus]
MSLEKFSDSRPLTLGVELELQIVSTHDYDLTPAAADLLRVLGKRKLPGSIVPEITDSMIELSTGICEDHADALAQLTEIRDALVYSADKLGVALSGGGTHPFQDWSQRRIFDKPRFKQISELYGYLSKQFTIFGQHVHVGCQTADEALVLLHGLGRYIPHLIALSASSPFVQGTDTAFHSARLNSVFAFPLSGRAPFVLTWEDFGVFFAKMTRTGVVKSMKDFYWDIRPKPEFGTIEVRVLDTPLTIEKAAAMAGLIQCLARWLRIERPFQPAEDDYLPYTFNRFQACRFGLDALYVDPGSGEHRPLREDLQALLVRLEPHATDLRAEGALQYLRRELVGHGNDACWIRATQAREHLLNEVVRRQTLRWAGRG